MSFSKRLSIFIYSRNYEDLITKIKMLENVKTTREQGLKNRIFLKDLLKHNNLEEFLKMTLIIWGNMIKDNKNLMFNEYLQWVKTILRNL